MIFPATVFCRVRNRKLGIKYENTIDGFFKLLFEYLCGNALINTIAISLRMAVLHATGNLYEDLNKYSGFAVKYLILALVLAYMLPFVERAIRKNGAFGICFHIELCHIKISDRLKKSMIFCYAAIMAMHHLIRIFDNSFWGDEGIVINAARKPLGDMLEYVAVNGHSPLHYVFAWVCVNVFGESGFIYHFSATLPYFMTVLFIVILVRKWFGNKVSAMLVTMSALLESAIMYNLEVRMYAWCQMFIFIAYLMLYGFFISQKDIYFFWMSICSLGAVYSHYFAFVSIGFMYFVLLIYIARSKFCDIWKAFISGGTVIGLLLPWLVFAKKVKGVVMSDYSIEMVSWHDCVEFIFYSKYSLVLLILFFIVLLIQFAYGLGIVEIKKNEYGKKILFLKFDFHNMHLDREWAWTLGGLLAVFGTIAISEVISTIVYPIIVLRYLYPSFIIIWLLFAINISRCKFGSLFTGLLIVFILITCYPAYLNTIKGEHVRNRVLESTLTAVSEIGKNDFIYTDIVHFDWTIADVYFPDSDHELFGQAEWWGPAEIPELDENIQYWLFLEEPKSEEITVHLEDMGYETELMVDYGFIGTGSVWIYKVIPKAEGR